MATRPSTAEALAIWTSELRLPGALGQANVNRLQQCAQALWIDIMGCENSAPEIVRAHKHLQAELQLRRMRKN